MRTTVTIADDLLAAAREHARSTGTTVSAVLEAALRRERAAPQHGDRPEVPVFRSGTGLCPGVDVTSNAALSEALDDGLPLAVRH
jgi:hypothetical protein